MTSIVANELDEIVETFDLLDEWDERYEYLIELGRKLAPLADEHKVRENEVQGCISTVWLVAQVASEGRPCVNLMADSDALIVKGLVAVLLAAYSGRTPEEILAFDALGLFEQLGLEQHLSSTRRNGLHSMVQRVREFATQQAA